jgi:hypothetical protein
MTIAPNPSTTGIFELDFQNANTLSVFNIAGEEILKLDVANEQKKIINLSAQPNGVYFIQVTDGKNNLKEKVILNK